MISTNQPAGQVAAAQRRTGRQMARAAAAQIRRSPVLPSMKAVIRLLAAAVIVASLVAGYYWLRDSSLMAVRSTSVEGVSGYQASEIRARLQDAAKGLSTLNPDTSALRAAVDGYPTVRSISVDGHPPHDLTVTVQTDRPIAVLVSGARHVAVAADGRLLPGVPTKGVPIVPTRSDLTTGGALRRETELVLAALRSAPASMREQIRFGGVARDTGLTFQLQSGVALRFGDGARLRAKWLAAEGVLADPEAAKATYIDLRTPERPAAGGVVPAAAVGEAAGVDSVATPDIKPQLQPEP